MKTLESERKNVTVKQSGVVDEKIILQFETYAKASQIMDFVSTTSTQTALEFSYHHNPNLEKYDAEISVTFKNKCPFLMSMLEKYIGVDLRNELPENVVPDSFSN